MGQESPAVCGYRRLDVVGLEISRRSHDTMPPFGMPVSCAVQADWINDYVQGHLWRVVHKNKFSKGPSTRPRICGGAG